MRALALLLAGALLGAGGIAAWLATRDGARLRAAALPQEPWVSVTASEPLLELLLDEGIADSPLSGTITKVRVDARPGTLIVQGAITIFGRRLVATARARPRVTEGELALGISDLNIGRLTVPFGGILERALAPRLHTVLQDAELVVTGVEVTRDGLTITARRQRPTATHAVRNRRAQDPAGSLRRRAPLRHHERRS